MSSFGIVVSTHSAPAFVELHMASASRFARDVPLVIHDDSSHDSRLDAIAARYDAALISTSQRLGHTRGDVASYVAGLVWAERHGVDYLVKVSRRFIPVKPWLPELRALVADRPATIGAADVAFGWTLRTEFICLRVDSWIPQLPALAEYTGGHVEEHMASLAQGVGNTAQMAFLGATRHNDNGNFLWYNFAGPERYAQLARRWGLDYGPEDFDTSANLVSH